MNCAQCDRPASVRIPSSDKGVCADHAIEFWTGLMKFAKEERPAPIAHDAALCACWACNDLTAARVSMLAAA